MPDWVKQGLTVGTENITGGGNKNIRMREYSISNYLGSRVVSRGVEYVWNTEVLMSRMMIRYDCRHSGWSGRRLLLAILIAVDWLAEDRCRDLPVYGIKISWILIQFT